MVVAILTALLSLQQLQVDAALDRNRAEVGETLVLTITVEATASEAVRILNPSLTALELLAATDHSEVSIHEGVATRTLTRTLRLRASSAGVARIGATVVRAGGSIARADPIEVTVSANEEAEDETLSPRIRALVERHVPPELSDDEVLVKVLTSADSIILGEQLDLAVVAWFPQHIRARLRTPPTLQPPQLHGAWTYSQGVPHAVDMRWRVRNSVYQVYVHSVVAFPLRPGVLTIGPATVSYSLPMSYSFLSREIRHEPESDRVFVDVIQQPAANRPSSFNGASGSELELSVGAQETRLSLGDATVVTATLSGQGNVALWPEPTMLWPDAVRAYPEGINVELDPGTELISGTKSFRYLVVPDSSGTHRITDVSYAYYDLTSDRYRILRVPELSLTVDAASSSRGERRSATRVLLPSGNNLSLQRLFATLPTWSWLLFLILPPAGALTFLAVRKYHSGTQRERQSSTDKLACLEKSFRDVLRDLVGTAERADSKTLAAALRAAGIEAPIAAHAARVRERLWLANYGPESGTDPEELSAEVAEVLRALPGETVGYAARGTAGALFALLFLAAMPHSLLAQSAERLYETGALRSAADSFEARARAEPWEVSHWYNLGAVCERAGAVQCARRAWIRAARLSPRSDRVRTALAELPPLDVASARLTRVFPLSPAEAFSVAALFWLLGWLSVALRWRSWIWWSACLLAVVCAAYGIHVREEYRSPVAFVVATDTPLRVAPYGPAQTVRILDPGTAVSIRRHRAPWILVERAGDPGWLLQQEVLTLK